MTAAVIRGDARNLPLLDASVDLIVTSPPYFALRDYRDGADSLAGQIGAEATPQAYVDALLEATAEWARVLKPSGSIFVDLGDKYDSEKSLMYLPERYRIGCRDQLGLIGRAVVIWSKPNGLPESVTDRVRRSHEDWVHLTKEPRYYSAVDEIRQPHAPETWTKKPGRKYFDARSREHQAVGGGGASGAYNGPNPLGALPGSVWEIASQPFKPPAELEVEHYAAFPSALVRRIILGWSPLGICTECGEGRRPVVSRHAEQSATSIQGARDRVAATGGAISGGTEHSTLRGLTTRAITGYACACDTRDAPTTPSVVLDPFGGTGTVAMVASVLGRRGISVDLSHDYGRLAQWRTRDPRERARALGVTPPPPVAPDQGGLFDLEAS